MCYREFYYIQMEKYARQAVSEGVKQQDDLRVLGDSEIYRVLNLHYNRNNHIEVSSVFELICQPGPAPPRGHAQPARSLAAPGCLPS